MTEATIHSAALKEEAATAASAIAQADPHKPKRTLGLKLFDNFLYTFFTNTTVLLVSLGFTYMTKHGKTIGSDQSVMRKVGTFFANRRAPIMKRLEQIGIKSEQAREDFTTVIFSFLDGTIFSFLVKPLEDRREKIAKNIDDALGTSPDNMKAYDVEPKQSWRSVVEGRALTSMIVLPVAFAMEKTGGNQAIFYRSGDKLANFVKNSIPKFDQWLTNKTIHHKNYFFQTGVFEAFYTSVCTAGLYLISRTVARKHPKKEHLNSQHQVSSDTPPTSISSRNEDMALVPHAYSSLLEPANQDKPTAKITNADKPTRVMIHPQTAELTA